MNKVERKIESFRPKMTNSNFQVFKDMCGLSIDIKAINTPNRKCLDLALFQVDELAQLFIQTESYQFKTCGKEVET